MLNSLYIRQGQKQSDEVITHLHNSIHKSLDRWLDVAFTGDHKEGVLEIPSWTRVCVCATQNYIVLPVERPIFPLECLEHLQEPRQCEI